MFEACVLCFLVQLISGHQLPPSSLSRTNKADPVVVIEIHGVPEDQAKQHSCVVKGNGKYKNLLNVKNLSNLEMWLINLHRSSK